MTPHLTVEGKEIIFRPPVFPSNEIKQILGGRLDKQRKLWRLQPTALNMLTLHDWYGDKVFKGAPQEVQDLCYEDWGFPGFEHSRNIPLKQTAEEHSSWERLYWFQQEAVEYLVCNPHNGGLVALEPGLGKSAVAAVAADILECYRVLIVAPLTLAKNWIVEFETWSTRFRSWSRSTPANRNPMTEAVVTNHELLFETAFFNEYGDRVEVKKQVDKVKPKSYAKWDEEVPRGPREQKRWIEDGPKVHDNKKDKKVPARSRKVVVRSSFDIAWDLIIVDESILLKNRKAVKVDILDDLVKYAGNVWLLSGSPTAKFRNDLYPQVKLIMPRGWPSYWRFAEFFTVIDKGNWGWKIEGDRPDHDPQEYLKDFFIAYSQKEVLPDLPDYIYDPIEIDLNPDQQRAFNSMTDDWMVDLKDGTSVRAENVISQMTRLAQITSNLVNVSNKRSSAKEDLLLDLIRQEDIRFPLLVWCWWVPTTISIFERLLEKTDLYVDYVHGGMKSEEKDTALNSYKTGKVDVLICQMGVGKFGHTLTSTRTVYYHDRHWDSDAYFQTLRRVRRIGLEHRPRLVVPRSLRSSDPIVELNLAGKLRSIAKLGRRDLQELIGSLGAGMTPWEMY